MRAPFVQDVDLTIHVGDALEVLRSLPDESVHCCVTSPPYWGLRDYGTGAWDGGDPDCDHRIPATGGNPQQGPNKGNNNAEAMPFKDVCGKCGATRVDRQLGLEATPDEYVAAMVAVFREVRRVLRADGTCWLNLGDSYNNRIGTKLSSHQRGLGFDSADLQKSWVELREEGRTRMSIEDGTLKEKDLCGTPWRVAFALQADGWYLRSDIVWSKPNPMPESVTDRPTKAHEYVFLLTRSPRYFFDAEAVREAYQPSSIEREKYGYNHAYANQFRGSPIDKRYPDGKQLPPREKLPCLYPLEDGRRCAECDTCHAEAPRGPDGRRATAVKGADGSIQHRNGERWPNGGRNIRSVWEIATQPYPQAHFATFPEALPERCILAGTSERGCCPVCGAPFVRQVDTAVELSRPIPDSKYRDEYDKKQRTKLGLEGRPVATKTTTGWRQSCRHYADPANWEHLPPVPCTVLDPFLGSGTTALVARRLGRRCIGIELSESYAALAAERTKQLSLLAKPA